ncbi:MAG: hypothetical protein ABIT08_12235 [Bacteroidia bacterium]
MNLHFTQLLFSKFFPKKKETFFERHPYFTFINSIILLKLLLSTHDSENIRYLLGYLLVIIFIKILYDRLLFSDFLTKLQSRILEFESFHKISFDDDTLFVLVDKDNCYNFRWSEFSTYIIQDKTLMLIQNDLKIVLKFDQKITGVENFNRLFCEVMERLKWLG